MSVKRTIEQRLTRYPNGDVVIEDLTNMKSAAVTLHPEIRIINIEVEMNNGLKREIQIESSLFDQDKHLEGVCKIIKELANNESLSITSVVYCSDEEEEELEEEDKDYGEF